MGNILTIRVNCLCNSLPMRWCAPPQWHECCWTYSIYVSLDSGSQDERRQVSTATISNEIIQQKFCRLTPPLQLTGCVPGQMKPFFHCHKQLQFWACPAWSTSTGTNTIRFNEKSQNLNPPNIIHHGMIINPLSLLYHLNSNFCLWHIRPIP